MPYAHLDPRLSERDYRTLCSGIVERLRALYDLTPTEIGVDLQPEGFWFTAVIKGRPCIVRTGQGNIQYADIAKEMALLANEPTDRGLEVISLMPPDKIS